MTTNSQDETFDRLTAANPTPRTGSVPQPTMSRTARFEEIIMTDTAQSTSTAAEAPTIEAVPSAAERLRQEPAHRRPNPSRWLPRMAMPAFAAFLMVMLGVGTVIGMGALVSPAPAVAAISDASSRTAAFNSGTSTTVIDFSAMDGAASDASIVIKYRYDHDDYEMSLTATNIPELPVADNLTTRHVDGMTYERQTGSDDVFQIVVGPSQETLLGGPADAESLQVLVDASDDFAEVTVPGAPGGERHFRGSLTRAALADLDPEKVPAGVTLLAGEGVKDLPPTVDISATVEGELLVALAISLVGPTDSGAIDATITTEFSDFGVPQNLEAPDEFLQMELLGPDGEPIEIQYTVEEQAAIDNLTAVIDELESRRPGLCANLSPRLPELDPSTPEGLEDVRAAFGAWFACYEDLGEPQMADALRANPGYPPIFLPEPTG